VKLTVLCVGGVKGPLAQVVKDYEERAARYWRLQVVEVEGGLGRNTKAAPQEVKKVEGSRLLGQLADSGEIVALTREGRQMGSREFFRYLSEKALRSVPEVTFVIGGAFGLDETVLARASTGLALSAFTLPHEFARLLLAEQLYRAGTLSRNEPYHKGP